MKNKLIIVSLVIVGLAIFCWVVFSKVFLPSIATKLVTTSINSALENLNFDNAQVIKVNQDFSSNEGMSLQMGINKGKVIIDSNS